MTWSLNKNEILSNLNVRVIREPKLHEFSGVSTDTRKSNSNKIFVALKGDAHDAHSYLQKAKESGAALLLIHKELADTDLNNIDISDWDCGIYYVDDTLLALQKLGLYWRKKQNVKVIGITGTNGKTSVKEFLYTIMQTKFSVHASQGSFNNHWGVPISLLELQNEHRWMISEMGMNHSGELSVLCKIAEPDIVIVTNVGRGHLEGLKTVENVAKAKEELFLNASPNATRIINLDNPYTKAMEARVPSTAKILRFSKEDNKNVDVCLKLSNMGLGGIEVEGRIANESSKVKVPVFGEHNLYNVMAAAALALAAGMSAKEIWQALPNCKSYWGRNQIVELKRGSTVIFDAYNANPESLDALLENINKTQVKGKKYLILGEMRELGEAAESEHYNVGKKAGELSCENILFMGPSADAFEQGVKASGFKNKLVVSKLYEEALAKNLASMLNQDDIVFIKASRGMQFERALIALEPLNFSTK